MCFSSFFISVFDSALGYNQSNYDELSIQIQNGLQHNPASVGKTDIYGSRFTVDIPVEGSKGNAIVRTGWIYKDGSDVPELTTLFVK